MQFALLAQQSDLRFEVASIKGSSTFKRC
jgi:hypothetical protein